MPIRLSPGRFTPVKPPKPAPFKPTFKDINPDIALPPRLGRPPRATDLIINRGFDGLTPQQAVEKIKAGLTGKLDPQNAALVEKTATDRYRDFNVALNNVYTAKTPNRQFLDGLKPTRLTVLGTMSSMQPVVYQVETAAGGAPRYYARDWSGRFAELPKAPGQVVMSADVRLDPPGIAMSYPKWTNAALAGPLTTITEY